MPLHADDSAVLAGSPSEDEGHAPDRAVTRLALAEKACPRYTSYPTAPHFSPAVGPETTEAWLAALEPDAALSLYLHVPFCAAMCHYCGCHTKVVRRREPIEAYAARLLAEIDLVAARTRARRVRAIHWGGGTPAMLGTDGLTRVVERIGQRFDLGGLDEHAIELDPRAVDGDLARTLGQVGVTRASLGVQDLNPHVQEAIGRVQPLGVVIRANALLREAGIGHVNIDLMYGLPHQSERDVIFSIAETARLQPDRFALFGYAHVPWMKRHQRLVDETALAGPAERLAQAERARETFEARGYEPIGLDHFALAHDPMAEAARTGMLKRNFQGYTLDQADALIGFGASAISRYPQGYAQNAPDFGAYDRRIDSGQLATVRGIAFTEEDRLRADVIETVMCRFAVDLGAMARRHGLADGHFASEIDSLKPLAGAGLIELSGPSVTVTEAGKPFVRLVAAAFDARLSAAGRHSLAV